MTFSDQIVTRSCSPLGMKLLSRSEELIGLKKCRDEVDRVDMFTSLLQLAGLAHRWPEISEEEVAAHCTPQSLWIVAGKSVYDVTGILHTHPGGPSALLRRGGGVRDCSEDFMFHSRQGRKEIDALKIGELAPSSAQMNESACSSCRSENSITRTTILPLCPPYRSNLSAARATEMSSSSLNVCNGSGSPLTEGNDSEDTQPGSSRCGDDEYHLSFIADTNSEPSADIGKGPLSLSNRTLNQQAPTSWPVSASKRCHEDGWTCGVDMVPADS